MPRKPKPKELVWTPERDQRLLDTYKAYSDQINCPKVSEYQLNAVLRQVCARLKLESVFLESTSLLIPSKLQVRLDELMADQSMSCHEPTTTSAVAQVSTLKLMSDAYDELKVRLDEFDKLAAKHSEKIDEMYKMVQDLYTSATAPEVSSVVVEDYRQSEPVIESVELTPAECAFVKSFAGKRLGILGGYYSSNCVDGLTRNLRVTVNKDLWLTGKRNRVSRLIDTWISPKRLDMLIIITRASDSSIKQAAKALCRKHNILYTELDTLSPNQVAESFLLMSGAKL